VGGIDQIVYVLVRGSVGVGHSYSFLPLQLVPRPDAWFRGLPSKPAEDRCAARNHIPARQVDFNAQFLALPLLLPIPTLMTYQGEISRREAFANHEAACCTTGSADQDAISPR
jgi:hypothetical protein